MSGWDKAEGKINKLIFECDNWEEADVVSENARARGDMKHVSDCLRKPSYSGRRYYVQIKTKQDYPEWYKPGYFNRKDTA